MIEEKKVIKITYLLTVILSLSFLACMDNKNLKEGLYAEMDTSKGKILLALEMEKTPLTVANFVGLVEGTKESIKKKQPFYDGLVFHRVIADFMIQGGDPQGNGTGGPGYQFEDEFHSDLKHDVAGIISMANSGPDSNGSQFFIIHNATPWLDGKHSVFGKVIEGIEVVNKIAGGDKINTVKIIRVGKKAEAFKITEEKFQQYRKEIGTKKFGQTEEKMKKLVDSLGLKNVITSDTGLISSITKSGDANGKFPEKGKPVTLHYTGQLENGEVFDSSHNRGTPFTFTLGIGQVIPGWDQAVAEMKPGEERTIILPPRLGYGSRGIGPIPPNSILVFKVELIK